MSQTIDNRVFINFIPQSATKDDLAAYFQQFGPTTDVYMPLVFGSAQHKGMGFVTYASVESAEAALTVPSHTINGETVAVEKCVEKKGAGKGSAVPVRLPAAAATPSGDRIFITSIPGDVTQEEIQEYFGQFGSWTDIFMPRGHFPAGHKGICFISYVSPSTVETIMASKPHVIHDHMVVVDVATPREPKGAAKGFNGAAIAQQMVVPQQQIVVHPQQQQQQQLGIQQQQLVYAHQQPQLVYAQQLGFAQQQQQLGVAQQLQLQQQQQQLQLQLQQQQQQQMGVQQQPMGVVQQQVPQGRVVNDKRLFLTRMAPDITKEDLTTYFMQFGDLEDVYIPPGGKCIGFVGFRESDSAKAVLQHPTHVIKMGSTVQVDVAVERPGIPGKGGKGGFRPF